MPPCSFLLGAWSSRLTAGGIVPLWSAQLFWIFSSNTSSFSHFSYWRSSSFWPVSKYGSSFFFGLINVGVVTAFIQIECGCKCEWIHTAVCQSDREIGVYEPRGSKNHPALLQNRRVTALNTVGHHLDQGLLTWSFSIHKITVCSCLQKLALTHASKGGN